MRYRCCILFSFLLSLTLPVTGWAASYAEIARLATQLERLSTRMAETLRYEPGYNSVQFSALRLSREAQQLIEEVARSREYPQLSAQFNELSRYFRNLEKSFNRAQAGEHEAGLQAQWQQIVTTHDQLQMAVISTGDRYNAQPYAAPPVMVVPQGNQPTDFGQTGDAYRPGINAAAQQRERWQIQRQSTHHSPVLERQYQRQEQRQAFERLYQRRHGEQESEVRADQGGYRLP